MNHFKLGEVAGKAWRLGHMGATAWEVNQAAHEAAGRLTKESIGSSPYEQVMHGFFEGSANVDREAAQVHPDELTFEERLDVVERLLERYQKIGTAMSWEAYQERHRLEQDVCYYFNRKGVVEQPEPFNGAAQAPDGAVVSLHIDPEREHQYVVVLVHTSADVYVCWATETEQQARSLFDALQHAEVIDVD